MTKRGIPFTKANAKEKGKKGGEKSKRLPLDQEWREKIYKIRKEGGKNTSDLQELYKNLVQSALKKKVNMVTLKAIEILFDRTFGTKQQIELTGKDGESISQQTIINVSPLKSKTKK